MIKEFNSTTAERGQEIAESVYYNFLDVLPPIYLRGGQGWAAGFQMGEPYTHMKDTRTNKFRPVYMTFTRADGHFYYQGLNFSGEVDSRPHFAQ